MMNNVKKGVCGSMQSAKSRKVLFELPRPRPRNAGRSAAVGRAGWLLRRAVKAEKSALRALRLVEEAMAKVEEFGKGFFSCGKEGTAGVQHAAEATGGDQIPTPNSMEGVLIDAKGCEGYLTHRRPWRKSWKMRR